MNERDGSLGGTPRIGRRRLDLERGNVDAGRVGGARDQVAVADQQRPGDAFVGDAACRDQRRRITRVDDADDRLLAGRLAARPRDKRDEARMRVAQT